MTIKASVLKVWESTLKPLFGEFSDTVTLRVMDTSATTFDPVYKEPVSAPTYTDYYLLARIDLEKRQMADPRGNLIDIDGTITFRQEDLDAAGIALKEEQLITYGSDQYRVTMVEQKAQVGDQFLLVDAGVERVRTEQ